MQANRQCELCGETFLARRTTQNRCRECGNAYHSTGSKYTVLWCSDPLLEGIEQPKSVLKMFREEMVIMGSATDKNGYAYSIKTGFVECQDAIAESKKRRCPPARQPGAPGTRHGIKIIRKIT